ncbi:MAG: hypothetical protein IPJ65_38135 [Archangiaceae bacterium]|nr:hypothetical protein [Archangiaceae bacterium]
MEIDFDDVPPGFYGTGNWADVASNLELFGVKRAHYLDDAYISALGVSRKDDLSDPETAAAKKAQEQAAWTRSNAKRATDPEQRKKRAEWEKRQYAKLRQDPEKMKKRAEYARKYYAAKKARAAV